jgi:predicted cobalt transporter CbtA
VRYAIAALIFVILAPALYVGVMSLFGAALENRKAWWLAAVMAILIILFAGFTTWH